MIHVDALDFSEWHSEEVISFFWRSVYDYVELYDGADESAPLVGRYCGYTIPTP